MKYFLCAVCWLTLIAANGQTDEITVKGKAKQTISGKGIVADIIYKSYPTGGLSGSFHDSTFSFSIFGSTKYQVTATANGYIPRTVIVDPKESKNRLITSDIELTPTTQ